MKYTSTVHDLWSKENLEYRGGTYFNILPHLSILISHSSSILISVGIFRWCWTNEFRFKA